MTDEVDAASVRRALELVGWPDDGRELEDIDAVETGVNDVFIVTTAGTNPKRAVCKFATFSWPVSLQAGVAAYHTLDAHSDLPAPDVYALRTDPPDLPAFHITELLSGDTLSDPSEPDRLAPARAVGAVIDAFGPIPKAATAGYGLMEKGDERQVTAEYDDCAEMLVEYGSGLYADPPSHDRLACIVPSVPDYLRENRHRLPSSPDPALVVTDFGPGNLLAPDGSLSGDGDVSELTGVLDLERAKLGPREFTAVNAEYLMTRGIEDPDSVVDALYDPLPFGPDLPNRDLYRLIAMGRSVYSLGLWYEEGSEEYSIRGEELAAEIERIVG